MISFTPSRPTVVQPNLYDRIAVTIYLDGSDRETAEELASIVPGNTYRLDKLEEKKTLSQVSYAWVLISKIAEWERRHGNQFAEKDDIYREYVRRFTKYEVGRFPSPIADKYMNLWQQQGTGWQCEVVNEIDGEKEIICYIGMKKWNRKELSDCIEMIKSDCIERRIPTERW